MLSNQQREVIRKAYSKGALKVRSVSPNGDMEWKSILHVVRSEVPWETIYEATTTLGSFVLTAGHRVFLNPVRKLETRELSTGDMVLCVKGDEVTYATTLHRCELPSRQFMYDLTAADWHNFVLHRSKVVISNSPDKFYHFRPPEYEGDIGQYNRIFGQIWEDEELLEYIERAMDWWNMFPPNTCGTLNNINKLCNEYSCWRTAILWDAITHATFALSANWVADEFDYSIGGVSLSIEKSSKYESLKQNAESQFDKATEAKARTVKYIKGLQQPRFGRGVRSAFGPFVGRGVLSPRGFVVIPIFLTFGNLLSYALWHVSNLPIL